MKAVGKVAVKLYEYLGASKQAARTASKGTAKQFSQILGSGQPCRGSVLI